PCQHGFDLRGRMEEVRQHLLSSLAIKYMRRSAYSERCKNDVVLATHRDRDVARSLGLFLLDLGIPLDPCEIDGVEHLLQVNAGGGSHPAQRVLPQHLPCAFAAQPGEDDPAGGNGVCGMKPCQRHVELERKVAVDPGDVVDAIRLQYTYPHIETGPTCAFVDGGFPPPKPGGGSPSRPDH